MRRIAFGGRTTATLLSGSMTKIRPWKLRTTRIHPNRSLTASAAGSASESTSSIKVQARPFIHRRACGCRIAAKPCGHFQRLSLAARGCQARGRPGVAQGTHPAGSLLRPQRPRPSPPFRRRHRLVAPLQPLGLGQAVPDQLGQPWNLPTLPSPHSSHRSRPGAPAARPVVVTGRHILRGTTNAKCVQPRQHAGMNSRYRRRRCVRLRHAGSEAKPKLASCSLRQVSQRVRCWRGLDAQQAVWQRGDGGAIPAQLSQDGCRRCGAWLAWGAPADQADQRVQVPVLLRQPSTQLRREAAAIDVDAAFSPG